MPLTFPKNEAVVLPPVLLLQWRCLVLWLWLWLQLWLLLYCACWLPGHEASAAMSRDCMQVLSCSKMQSHQCTQYIEECAAVVNFPPAWRRQGTRP